MAWWRRKRGSSSVANGRHDGPDMQVDFGAVRDHLRQFVSSRRGVEAYLEPPTNVTSRTVILIAHDGEWTRRAVGVGSKGIDLVRSLGVPVYDVHQTGYPQRMRDWNSRQRRNGSA